MKYLANFIHGTPTSNQIYPYNLIKEIQFSSENSQKFDFSKIVPHHRSRLYNFLKSWIGLRSEIEWSFFLELSKNYCVREQINKTRWCKNSITNIALINGYLYSEKVNVQHLEHFQQSLQEGVLSFCIVSLSFINSLLFFIKQPLFCRLLFFQKKSNQSRLQLILKDGYL